MNSVVCKYFVGFFLVVFVVVVVVRSFFFCASLLSVETCFRFALLLLKIKSNQFNLDQIVFQLPKTYKNAFHPSPSMLRLKHFQCVCISANVWYSRHFSHYS